MKTAITVVQVLGFDSSITTGKSGMTYPRGEIITQDPGRSL